MDDLISRQAAIEAIEEYADRLQMVDWKENPGVPYKAYALNWCINTIRDLPTIEAVPLEDYRSMEQTVYKLTQALAEAEPKQKLVRCKECKHYEDEEPSMVYCPNIVGGWVSNIFYCGYGERKDEVEE